MSTAYQALATVFVDVSGKAIINVMNFAKFENILDGQLSKSRVVDGFMVNKDVASAKIRRRIAKSCIVLI